MRLHLPILVSQSQTSAALFDDDDEVTSSDDSVMDSVTLEYMSDESKTTDTESDSDSEDMPFGELLLKLDKTNEYITLLKHGYKYMHKIRDISQGELIKAAVTSKPNTIAPGSHVAIKKIDKELLQEHISIEDDFNICVQKDIIKEASILQSLTVSGHSNAVKYVDFFESDSYYYLVTEWIDNAVTLQEFIHSSQQLINDGTLTRKEHSKTVNSILYQLSTTVNWLHNNAQCCHLNIALDNIMVQNTNENIKITLCDFGCAELFGENDDEFVCTKTELNSEYGYLLAPEISDIGMYDGRSTDVWSLGMILYTCMVGEPLYYPFHMWDEPKSGYLALKQNKLRPYLSEHGLLKYFQCSSFALLNRLTAINPQKRINAAQIVQHRWFQTYQD